MATSALRRTFAPHLIALAVLLMALTATLAIWRAASEELQRSRRAEFDVESQQTVRRIDQRMATYEQVARGTAAFLLGSMNVSRADYRLFVDSLRLEDNFPGLQGLALAELIPADKLIAHEAAMRRDVPGYAVHPATPASQVSSIVQIEPFNGLNPRALGFDMFTEPVRRAAMERARDSGQAAASGKVRLVQENGRNVQAGLVMYLPVYRRGAAVDTVDERRAALIGWVGAPFRMNDLMAGLSGERSAEIMVSIYDGDKVDEAARLYDAGGDAHAALFQAVSHVDIAGHPWTLVLRSTPVLEQRLRSSEPAAIAVIGVAVSALLAMLVWSLASGRQNALAQATAVSHRLSDSESRWQYALEGAGDGVWDWDRGSGEVVYSRRWKEMLGYDEADIPDEAEVWERLIHPDDYARVMRTLEAYVESTGQLYEAQYRMICKDGSLRWILARGMAVTRGADGKPLRTIGTHTDITRSKEDEHTLRMANERLAAERRRVQLILDHSHDAFVAVTSGGRISDWNAKAEIMFGWTAAEAIGRDLAELIVPANARAAHSAGFRRFARSGMTTLLRNVVEVDAVHRSGRLVPIELAIAGFPENDGYAVSAFIRDVTERRAALQLEAERSAALEEARNALQHAQKLEAVGKLTGGIAHDFNNVLHVIGGNVQLLQLGAAGDERTHKRLRSIQSAVDRGAKLSSQLLAFARRQPLQPVVVNPLRVLRNMDDLLQRALGESVTIGEYADADLWNILVDPGQLENVVLNLAINARDAMPGGGTLAIELRNATLDGALVDLAPGDYVRLSFADTGVGMSEDVRALAFEPFFTTKPVGQGTGLGLSMAYGFVKQSGGHIQLESTPGTGTCVIIYLPRSEQAEARTVSAPSEEAVGGSETVLVVEDDAEVRVTAVSTLAALGYRVLDAEDGATALAILEAGVAIDLLFTDVVMPGPVSSTELAERARRLLPRLAVLFTSGYTRNALTSGGRLESGVQLLSKPYRSAQLAQRVREVLARA